jgi:hypothetical protein
MGQSELGAAGRAAIERTSYDEEPGCGPGSFVTGISNALTIDAGAMVVAQADAAGGPPARGREGWASKPEGWHAYLRMMSSAAPSPHIP